MSSTYTCDDLLVCQALRVLVDEVWASSSWLALAEHVVALSAIAWLLAYVLRRGPRLLLDDLVGALLRSVPGAASAVDATIQREVDKAVGDMFGPKSDDKSVPRLACIPAKSVGREEIMRRLRALSKLDSDAEGGRLFAYVYAFGEDEESHANTNTGKSDTRITSHHDLLARAFQMFMHANALNPVAFPALRRMEVEVVRMACALLNGEEGVACGTMTSGGTESICMAVVAYRERARTLGLGRGRGQTPNIVLPLTAHPAFAKAAHYYCVEARFVPVDPLTLRADVRAMAQQVDADTICIVGSAPQYPNGVVDPIEEIAALAQARGIPFHVDACVGGYLLPWVERLGFPVPPFDFRVPGVTSISADLHKYGYAAKGASTILWRSDEYRQHQFFAYSSWPGGLFVSPGAQGTRSGGAIAAAWAALQSMGEEGYLHMAGQLMDTSQTVQVGIAAIDGLRVLGEPHMSIVSFGAGSDANINIFCVADRMENEHGWTMERQCKPDCLHLSLMPVHTQAHVHQQLLRDLQESVEFVRAHPEMSDQGSAAMYGMVASIPSGAIVDTFLTKFLLKVYS